MRSRSLSRADVLQGQREYFINGLDQMDTQGIAHFHRHFNQVLLIVFRQNDGVDPEAVGGQKFR